jgi:2-succinyl-5-enolpyruvyl-6-hydroxy-3-cyclohexene-1-carboxylate synthase
MDAPNRNTLWANIFVDELARGGLRAVCIAPGSRSTPLTIAFARHPAIKTYSLLDERGAAFFALGRALATEEPVAVVCTSGTAAANFFPAVVEADSARVPLLVLTTDRPHELRHSGSNQTIDQINMFGNHVRWFVDIALPETDPLAIRSLQTLAARALAASKGVSPGPVHLNFPFRKPLEPTPVAGDVPATVLDAVNRVDNRPFTEFSRGILQPSPQQISGLANLIQNSRRGLIICGPRSPGGDFAQAVVRLAKVAGYPILADALSGVRFGQHVDDAQNLIVSGYETFLQQASVAGCPSPELIIRFGAMPISKMLGLYLGCCRTCHHVQISESGVWQDDTHTTSDFIWADPVQTCLAVAEQLSPRQDSENTWPGCWAAAEATAWEVIRATQAETFFEGLVFADVVDLMPENSTIFSASSLPVRHLDQFAHHRPTKIRILANRGASGIDGTIASALGAAAGSESPLVLVTGDLAFYHDLNSLLAVRRCGVPLIIVLINNNGGGIFHRLPISEFEPPFTDLFITPHGLTFEPAARLFGVDYVRTDTRQGFRELLAASLVDRVSRIIEVPTDARLHEQVRKEIIVAAKDRLASAAAERNS